MGQHQDMLCYGLAFKINVISFKCNYCIIINIFRNRYLVYFLLKLGWWQQSLCFVRTVALEVIFICILHSGAQVVIWHPTLHSGIKNKSFIFIVNNTHRSIYSCLLIYPSIINLICQLCTSEETDVRIYRVAFSV